MRQVHPASVDEVRDEIRAISRSKLFAHSRRRVELLEYLCNMVLLGRQDEVKESTIALEVFERTAEFDDKKDSIVRVEAHRLRQRLAKYYETEGAHDRVVIELLPGGYIPRFVVREPGQILSPAPEVPSSKVGRPFQPNWKFVVAGSAVVAFVLGASIASSRRSTVLNRVPPRTVAPAPSPSGTTISPVATPPSGGEIRILAGSTKPYIDRAGRHWSADRFFNGGTAQPGLGILTFIASCATAISATTFRLGPVLTNCGYTSPSQLFAMRTT